MKQIIAAFLCIAVGGFCGRAADGVELIETKPFRVLQGVIHNDAAKPLGGVRVEVFTRSNFTVRPDAEAAPVAVQWTANDGAFSFANLPAGVYELRADVPGGVWQMTRLLLKVQPDNPRAKARLIIVPLMLAETAD